MDEKNYLKKNLIRLADEHRAKCSTDGCGINLYALYQLLKLADIQLTQQELEHFL